MIQVFWYLISHTALQNIQRRRKRLRPHNVCVKPYCTHAVEYNPVVQAPKQTTCFIETPNKLT
jgi:hypothetical protein